MSELSIFMGKAPNGLSARGGQCRSACVPGGDPSGSSSGSAVGTSVGFGAAALGHDTYGSCIMPAGRNALFAIRPSRGLVSRNGLIGCAESFDTIGPMAKSVYDTALLLGLIAGTDLNDPSSEPPYRNVEIDQCSLKLKLRSANSSESRGGDQTGGLYSVHSTAPCNL